MSCCNIKMDNRRVKIAKEISDKHNKPLIFTETTKICPNLECESHIEKQYYFLLLSTFNLKICAFCDTHLFWDLEKGQKGL